MSSDEETNCPCSANKCKCLKTAEEIERRIDELRDWALSLLWRKPALDGEILHSLGSRLNDEVYKPVDMYANDYKACEEDLREYSGVCQAVEHHDISAKFQFNW